LKKLSLKKRTPRYQLGLPPSFLLAVLLTGFYTLLCLWIQPNSLRAVLRVFRPQPLLIVLNCLPIGLLILCFAFLLRNVFTSACLVGTCCAFLSLANRIKIEIRDEPVFPRDFTLLKEAAAATGSYHIRWPWGVIGVILLCMVLMLIGARLVGCKPFPVEKLRNHWGQALGAAVSLGVLVAVIFTVYASNDLYNSFSVSNPYYVPSVFNELGFPYCFCHHFTTYTVDKPAGYSRAEAESWETGDNTGLGKDVNVIMVMNEAFSDITDLDVFTYSEEDDPLKNLHAAQDSDHCISGHIVVPGFAGGTANTEFDVLTGMQTNALSATTTSAFRAVNRNLDSLFRVFGGDGYQTLFMHPGDDWFYNRENVYQWMGAQEALFVDGLEGLTYKGSWVTDDSMAAIIQQKFEEAMTKDCPFFNYTVTIQNHMSYGSGKYGEGYEFPPVQTSAALSEQAATLLSVYIEGVRDADAMLGRLTDYFSQRQEPVVLVFLGDHLPYLGDSQLAYRELGAASSWEKQQNLFDSYKTPYVIWANDAAAGTLDWEETVAGLELPEDGTLSACYLGATVLELTGRGQESPWFSYLTEVRRQLPVIQLDHCMLPDGTVAAQDSLPDEQQELIGKLRRWSYYKLKVKDVS